jgi:class 3 adenylate cyclase
MADPGGVRIGDAERQQVVDMLRRHTSEGRLTLDEFSERAGQVYAAQTQAELDAVLADLPNPLLPGVAPPAGTTTPVGGTVTGPARRKFVGVMSSSVARGPWRAPAEIKAVAFWGSVFIDLTNAVIDSPVVEIKATAVMGSVTVRVPEGIPVDVDGFVVMGGTTNMVRNTPAIPGAPLIRIRTRGLWGGVTVRNPRKKRLRGAIREHHDRRDRRRAAVQDMVDDALDRARTSLDRALGTGGHDDDRIPDMPERGEGAETRRGGGHGLGHLHGHRHAPAPAPPAAPAPPPVPPVPPIPPVRGMAGANGAGNGVGGAEALSPSRIPPGTLTILVSDIVGSTKLAQRLGDQKWVETLQVHNAIVRRHVAEHSGVEVKNQGDGFLIVFPSARDAVLSAIAIQRSMSTYRHEHPDVEVLVRVGLHTGEVVATEDDIFGQNVVVASRIADEAGAGEIVVSGLTRDLTASASDLGFATGTDVALKGIAEPYRVHRVLL